MMDGKIFLHSCGLLPAPTAVWLVVSAAALCGIGHFSFGPYLYLPGRYTMKSGFRDLCNLQAALFCRLGLVKSVLVSVRIDDCGNGYDDLQFLSVPRIVGGAQRWSMTACEQ